MTLYYDAVYTLYHIYMYMYNMCEPYVFIYILCIYIYVCVNTCVHVGVCGAYMRFIHFGKIGDAFEEASSVYTACTT